VGRASFGLLARFLDDEARPAVEHNLVSRSRGHSLRLSNSAAPQHTSSQ
jgi:hypothetical protein